MQHDLLSLIGRLLLSTLLGALVGFQREQSGRPAGLRTHTLVCLGAALITLVSESYVGDEARISAQIVSGIGFLGAGTIIREGPTVRGLTTAASLWAVAGLGIACGRGGDILVLAMAATILILLTLSVGKNLEERVFMAREKNVLSIRGEAGTLPQVLQALIDAGIVVEGVTRRRTERGSPEVALRLHLPSGMEKSAAVRVVMSVQGLHEASWAAAKADEHGG
jgi:putative Mg2+ transporter-C (MgtC) family protein